MNYKAKLLLRKKMKRYTNEFKQKIVSEYSHGENCKELCIKYKIAKSCLYDWIKQYKARVHKGNNIFTYKQYEEIMKKIYQDFS